MVSAEDIKLLAYLPALLGINCCEIFADKIQLYIFDWRKTILHLQKANKQQQHVTD